MGAGKTSVGRALGSLLNWQFEDLDDRIEQREGRRIAEIFRDVGEQEFRRREHEALKNLLLDLPHGGQRIVALGGGAFVQERNAALLKSSTAPTVFLDAPVDDLWQRCSQQAVDAGTERPLLASREQFRRLYKERRRNYSRALHRIHTENRTVEAIAAEIARRLRLKRIEIRIEQGEAE
ncbi:MAG TPA: shikimate kinase [Candidatus Acidoferrales bacterium]|nr:shikimate kinase [Candidatus Acidoferrales bacterium]